jgi:hypothetical protein
VEDASEDPSSTLLNLCAVLGMLGRHREALQYAQDAAQMLCRWVGDTCVRACEAFAKRLGLCGATVLSRWAGEMWVWV